MPKNQIIYVFPSKSTFILRDIEILNAQYVVKENFFAIQSKIKIPIIFLQQFIFLLRNIRKSTAIICHFAGYSTMLPVIFSKIFKKPCLIIVAGNDGACFRDFNYGNYSRKLLGFATRFSLQRASHILPVHESLYLQEYSYYEGGMPFQGYSYFCPKAKDIPFTPVYYGYDSNFFKPLKQIGRKKMTFLTVGNLADPYSFKRKGYDLILMLASELPEISITLVGWDSKTDLQVPGNVHLLPFKSQDEIIKLFNEHQFYFQLSIMEGFPNALAEAMLCGCIPIGSNVSGIPYIIQDTGAILKQRNIEELKRIVLSLINESNDELEKRSLAARERVKNEFTYENRKQKIINIIESFRTN